METMSAWHTKCLNCGGHDLAKMSRFSNSHLLRCSSCKLVFAGRIPTDQELIQHYKGYGREDTLSDLTRQRYRELLSGWQNLRHSNNILDVGAGNGFFIQEAIESGWQGYATEYTPEAVTLCRAKGAAAHQGDLDTAPFADGSFDIITAFEVLEHVRNPLELMRNVARLLRPNGMFYLTTPNFNSVSRHILGVQWHVIEYPEHLFYFTPATLRNMAKRAGLAVEWCKTDGLISRLIQPVIRNSKQHSDDSSSIEAIRIKTETNLFWKLAKRGLNTSLKLTGTGDSLKAQLRRFN